MLPGSLRSFLKPSPTCRFLVRALLSWSMTYQAQFIRKRSCKECNNQYRKHCCFGWFWIKDSHRYYTNQWFSLRKHFEISIQSGEQSLIINHEKSSTLKQDALKLPKNKTEKGRRWMFLFSAHLYSWLVWEFDCLAKVLPEQTLVPEYLADPYAKCYFTSFWQL